MKKIFALLVSTMLTISLLVSCASESSKSSSTSSVTSSESTSSIADNSLQNVLDSGKLVIGLDDTFAPMGFRDKNGELVGFDIDLAVAVCEILGVEPEFQPIDWAAKELELNGNKIDCIWNGMSATPERKESMSLSQPYLNNKIIVMTTEGITIKDKEDLANHNIAIQMGSAALEAVKSDEIYASIKDKIIEYETYDIAIMEMQAGRADCMIVDEVLGNYKNSQLNNIFETAEFDFGDDLYSIGFRKSDVALTQAINDAINELIVSGKAAEISTKWFGTNLVIENQ